MQNAKQASRVLLGAAGIALAITVLLLLRGSGPELPSEEEILRNTPTSGLRGGVKP